MNDRGREGTWECWYCGTVLPRTENYCPNHCVDRPDFWERIEEKRLSIRAGIVLEGPKTGS